MEVKVGNYYCLKEKTRSLKGVLYEAGTKLKLISLPDANGVYEYTLVYEPSPTSRFVLYDFDFFSIEKQIIDTELYQSELYQLLHKDSSNV